MRFEVPQFIEIEDKIFGPLTWKQFAYIAGGLGALLMLFFTLPRSMFVFVGIPVAALSGTLAFHKVNNRPFSYYLEAMFNYFLKSKLYLWQRSNEQTVEERSVEAVVPRSTVDTAVAQPKKKNLQELARELDLAALKGDQTQAEKWNET